MPPIRVGVPALNPRVRRLTDSEGRGGVVTIVEDTLTDQLTVDFALACAELQHARQLARLKDTAAHRAAVAEWERAVDVVLDMFLQADPLALVI